MSNEQILEYLKEIDATLKQHGELLCLLRANAAERIVQTVECYYCGDSFVANGWPAPAFCETCSRKNTDPSPRERDLLLAPLDGWTKCRSCGELFRVDDFREFEKPLEESCEDDLCDICTSELERCEYCESLLDPNEVELLDYAEGGRICAACADGLEKCRYCGVVFHLDEIDTYVCDECMPVHEDKEDLLNEVWEDGIEMWYQANDDV